MTQPTPSPEPVHPAGCYGSGFTHHPEHHVCSACACTWRTDEDTDPNPVDEWCDSGSCPCHTEAFAEQRYRQRNEDRVEALYREAYPGLSPLQVYQMEGR